MAAQALNKNHYPTKLMPGDVRREFGLAVDALWRAHLRLIKEHGSSVAYLRHLMTTDLVGADYVGQAENAIGEVLSRHMQTKAQSFLQKEKVSSGLGS